VSFLVFLLLTACAHYQPGEVPSSIQIGSVYYTQFTLQYEKNRHRTTNYRKGIMLPVNSEVTLVSFDKKKIIVRLLPSQQELIIENVAKHTNEDSIQAFHKMFAETPRDLSRFSKKVRGMIERGEVEKGMSKDAVLISLGDPPKIGTPSLESNHWRYWANRFNTFIVHFDKGRVVRIQQ
ncbi:MAG: hypothetical protein ABFS02_10720, partial [Pseudomonadota bacterium]